jgi:hypothetical protein
MVAEALAADPRAAMSICIITPTKYSGIQKIFGEEITQPVNTIIRCPCFFPMAVQAMDGDDARF